MARTTDRFTFKTEWKDMIDLLPVEDRLPLYEAIIVYATTGDIVSLPATSALLLKVICKDINDEQIKRDRISQSRRESGSKGGKKSTKISKISKCKQNKQLLNESQKDAPQVSLEPKQLQSLLIEDEKNDAIESSSLSSSDVPLLSPTPPINSILTPTIPETKKEIDTKVSPKKKTKTDLPKLREEFIESLPVGAMRNVMVEWLAYRSKIRKPYKSTQGMKQCYDHLCSLAGNNPEVAMEIINQSIQNEYQGLFAVKKPVNQQQKQGLYATMWQTQQDIDRIIDEMP